MLCCFCFVRDCTMHRSPWYVSRRTEQPENRYASIFLPRTRSASRCARRRQGLASAKSRRQHHQKTAGKSRTRAERKSEKSRMTSNPVRPRRDCQQLCLLTQDKNVAALADRFRGLLLCYARTEHFSCKQIPTLKKRSLLRREQHGFGVAYLQSQSFCILFTCSLE